MWEAVSQLLSEGKLIAGVLLALLAFAGSSQALLVWLVRRTATALDGFRTEMKTHNDTLTAVLDRNTSAMAVMNHNTDDLLDMAHKCAGPKRGSNAGTQVTP